MIDPMPSPLRKQLYALMIVVAAGMALGRIGSAELLYEPSLHRIEGNPDDHRRKWPALRPVSMPTFSSNDRSRWCTVRALVDHGTFVIGDRDPSRITETNKYGDAGIVFEDGWQTVDKIMNPETREFYSTKPPLLPILMAGEYWVLKRTLGWTMADDMEAIVRVELVTFNLVPWIVALVLLSRLIERFGTTDWGRLFAMATACFGTLTSPFLIAANNHVLATCAAAFAIHFAVKARLDSGGSAAYFFCGLFSAFTACNELPALAFAVGMFVLLFVVDARRTLTAYLAGAAIPAAALLVSNYVAMGELSPAYSKFGGPWYQYEGSHWRVEPGQVKHGIDWAARYEDRATYAFHVVLGHHGLLSLTPWVLPAFVGMVRLLPGLRGLRSRAPVEQVPIVIAAGSLGLTLTIVGFYLIRSDNYGGWSNGPRWLMWLSPFWLACMLPCVDWMASSRRGRAVACVLLALSVLSVSYSSWNPWRHPWLYRWMDANGWIPY